MATTVATLPIAEYLRTSYTPDADFVDGELEERNVGEYDHSNLQGILYFLFRMNKKLWNVRPIIEQRTRVSESRVRVPDLAVLRGDAPRDPVATVTPLICIEVLSSEDRISRAEEVLADNWRMGVRHVWLFNPTERIAYTYDGKLHVVTEAALTVPETPIRVELEWLFTEMDQ